MNVDLKPEDLLDYKIRTLEFKINRLQHQCDETITVTTQNGKVKGAKRKSLYGDSYNSFERIPYAQKPVGELRFRAPKPIGSWKHVKDCTKYADKPRQLHYGGEVVGSEDCLYLNVYASTVSALKSRPVMVWIYGGGMVFGEANPEWYGPDYFMKKDIVLVTVQYRVGALGFLSLKDPHLHIPGNAGLKDQILALKWIKRNIGAFGGNPDCVTMFGESAGGFATTALMSSPQARGLFHRAIAQSGVATHDEDVINPEKKALALAEKAGYTGENDEREIVKYLLNCSAEQLVEAERDMAFMDWSDSDSFTLFGVVLEPYMTTHTVIDRPLSEMWKHAWGRNIPFMLGATSNEMLFLKPLIEKVPEIIEHSLQSCIDVLPKGCYVDRNSEEAKQKGLKLRQLHIKGEQPTLEETYEIYNYRLMWHPIHEAIRERLNSSKKHAPPIYLYRFDFESPKMEHPFRLMRWGRGVSGVAHTDELAYLFSSVLARRMDRYSRERITLERMINLWTSFAESGNPNSTKVGSPRQVKWLPIDKKDPTLRCLNIGDTLEFIELPEMKKLQVWQELYDLHRELPKHSAEVVDLAVYVKSSL